MAPPPSLSTLPTILFFLNSSIFITGSVFKIHLTSSGNAPLPPTRVAEVAREHRWQLTKSLDLDTNFKPENTLFCRELRFVAIYALFGNLWAKKVPF